MPVTSPQSQFGPEEAAQMQSPGCFRSGDLTISNLLPIAHTTFGFPIWNPFGFGFSFCTTSGNNTGEGQDLGWTQAVVAPSLDPRPGHNGPCPAPSPCSSSLLPLGREKVCGAHTSPMVISHPYVRSVHPHEIQITVMLPGSGRPVWLP